MKIYNTLTRTKEEFVPLTPGEVRMYVCGLTVYDLCHIGHARSAIVFDVIQRYLRFKGYRVTFVKNFTDVDDKIIRRAKEEGVDAREVSERYIRESYTDMDALGIARADVEPKATEHLPEMIALIERLVAGGFAYVIDGDVYFEVRRFPAYGRLSGKNLDELLAGARVDVDERKRDPRDFALWKAAKPGEPSWPSPWGAGRPGWHIECSAMSQRYLDNPADPRATFDIHGGGEDLIFPHHECEIAQSEAGIGKPFVRYWIHNGFVNISKEKMSKSLGNVLLIRDLLERHHEDSLRSYLLGTHYRHPIEFWNARVDESRRAVSRVRRLIVDAFELQGMRDLGRDEAPTESSLQETLDDVTDARLRRELQSQLRKFSEAMDDDFNTPQAQAVLFELHSLLSGYREAVERREGSAAVFTRGAGILLALGRVLGLFRRRYRRDVLSGEAAKRRNNAEELKTKRDEARKQRDWKLADELRARIEELGATVEDTPSGARLVWKNE